MLSYEAQHDLLEEEFPTIIECLGLSDGERSGAQVVSITKTEKGYKFIELCDEYYGITLSQEQMERFIQELQELAGVK